MIIHCSFLQNDLSVSQLSLWNPIESYHLQDKSLNPLNVPNMTLSDVAYLLF